MSHYTLSTSLPSATIGGTLIDTSGNVTGVGNLRAGQGGAIYFNNRSAMWADGNGTIRYTTNDGSTAGVLIDFSTDAVWKIRNRANSADAALTALSISTSTAATFHTTTAALTNGAGVASGTLTTAPSAGNPTKWIGINDNGTTRYIPAW